MFGIREEGTGSNAGGTELIQRTEAHPRHRSLRYVELDVDLESEYSDMA